MVNSNNTVLEKQVNAIRQLIRKRQYHQAQNFIKPLLTNNNGHPLILSLAAEFYLSVNQIQQALKYIKQALLIYPEDINYQLIQIHCFIKKEDISDARVNIKKMLTQRYSNHILLNELASVCVKVNLVTESLSLYRQAIYLQPKFYGYHYNLASTLRMIGDIEGAEKELNETLMLQPNDFEAIQMRSSLKKQQPNSNHVKQLEQKLAETTENKIGKMHLNFSLAKELEDLGDYTLSFKHLQSGNETRRKLFNYNIQADLEKMQKQRKTFDVNSFNANKNSHLQGEEAIFILGLPRTGSTLVERIISNHSQVYSAGELNTLPNLLNQENVQSSKRIDFCLLGKSYLSRAKQWTDGSPYFIDKWPMNSLNVGVIHSALPSAKIIWVTRHPLDTCYAIYKNLFANTYPFSYSLKEIALYYIEHYKLMTYWSKLLGSKIHSVKYEALINEPKTQIENLLEYCQLDWQQSCLTFETNKHHSATASATQIRKSFYNDSIGNWKNYHQELSELKEELENAGINCN